MPDMPPVCMYEQVSGNREGWIRVEPGAGVFFLGYGEVDFSLIEFDFPVYRRDKKFPTRELPRNFHPETL